jgi:hypothetical protein
MWHQECVTPLKVVLMVKSKRKTPVRAPGVFCRRDMAFSDDQRIAYDRLRLQSEVNFRDAQPYGGVEDFMTVPPTAVTHAASFALFMVNVTPLLLPPVRTYPPQFGIRDVKAYCRGHQDVAETFKLLPQQPAPSVIAQRLDHLANLGRVHNAEPTLNMS